MCASMLNLANEGPACQREPRRLHSRGRNGGAYGTEHGRARGDSSSKRLNAMPLTDLDPPPDYELVCRASGGWAEQVTDPAALPDALARALKVVREEKRQTLLNVIVKKPA